MSQFAVLLGLLAFAGLAQAEDSESVQISAGDCVAGFSWRQGLTLSYQGVPVITRSTLAVRDHTWKTVYCQLARIRPRISARRQAEEPSLVVTYPTSRSADPRDFPFAFEYRLRLAPTNQAFVSFQYQFRREEPAVLEYCLGRFLETLFVGRTYAVAGNGEPTRGVFPILAPPPGSGMRPLARDFRALTVQMPLADLYVRVAEGSDPLTLFDARDQYWAAFSRDSAVWMGVQCGLREKKAGYCAATLEFHPRRGGKQGEIFAVDEPPQPPQPVPEAWLPASGGAWLTKALTSETPSFLAIRDAQRLLVPPTVSAQTEERFRRLAANLASLYGTPLELRHEVPQGQPVLIPTPQRVEWRERDFVLDSETQIVLASDANATVRRLAQDLAQYVEQVYGLSLPQGVCSSPAEIPAGSIVLGQAGDGLDEDPSRRRAGSWPGRVCPDSYVLDVSPERVWMYGHREAGTFYGLHTLRQLFKVGELGEVAIIGARIEDWPDFAFRGVHLLADNHALAWHKELIHKVLAPLKINRIVLECEYARWESHPEIAPEWAMTKEEMRELKAYAEAHFIDVIPLIQTLGHCDWLFANGEHLELAEDPETPYAYCVSQPKTYEIIFDIFREAIDLFHPEYLHIGHDEVANRGRFPYCEKCRRHAPADLFLRDVVRLHDFLAERGVKTMMWGDMLLRPEEACDAANGGGEHQLALARGRLPRDITICDWHYGVFPDYPSLKLLREEGFDTIGASWFNPQNIVGLSRAAARARARGMLQTTWTGYEGNQTALREHYDQLAAYILAAEYAWSPNGPDWEALDYRSGEVLARLGLGTSGVASGPRSGMLFPLRPFCSVALRDDVAGGWTGYGPEHDLRQVPTGTRRLGEVLFQISRSEDPPTPVALMLAGKYTPERRLPQAVSIPFGGRARSLVFLHTCGWKTTAGRTVGSYVIGYDDGSQEVVELVYGYNITAWNDRAPTFRAPLVWESRTSGGSWATLRALTWNNPRPERVINHVEFRSANTEVSPTLVALTAVE